MAKKKATQDNSDGTLFGVLTYLVFIVGVIWYLVDEKIQKNTFAKFHFKQSLVMVIAYFILQIAASILGIGIIVTLIGLLFLVLVILGIVNVVNGKEEPLPVIGQYAEKFKF
jgi:uncharacterized membrane protein